MKKVIFTLLFLFVMGMECVTAQNYDVIYSLKMNPESIIKMISKESGAPKAMLSFLKDDIKNAKLKVALRMTKDKSDMKFLKDQSKFEISMMGLKMDAAAMFDNAGINTYSDYAKKINYTKVNIDGKNYIIKDEWEPEPQYKAMNLYKKILGHECRKMIDAKKETAIWYATDIPFKTEMYPGVPGLVLEITEEAEGFTFTAVSVTATNKDVTLPKNAKEITKEQADEMLENMH